MARVSQKMLWAIRQRIIGHRIMEGDGDLETGEWTGSDIRLQVVSLTEFLYTTCSLWSLIDVRSSAWLIVSGIPLLVPLLLLYFRPSTLCMLCPTSCSKAEIVCITMSATISAAAKIFLFFSCVLIGIGLSPLPSYQSFRASFSLRSCSEPRHILTPTSCAKRHSSRFRYVLQSYLAHSVAFDFSISYSI